MHPWRTRGTDAVHPWGTIPVLSGLQLRGYSLDPENYPRDSQQGMILFPCLPVETLETVSWRHFWLTELVRRVVLLTPSR